MNVSGLIGWMIVGVAAAAAICSKKREEDKPAPPEKRRGAEADEMQPGEAGGWCLAIEKLLGGAVLIFDGGMRLVAAGERASREGFASEPGLHLIDLAPAAHTKEFMDGAAAARRGRTKSWEILDRGETKTISSAPVPRGCFLIAIRKRGER